MDDGSSPAAVAAAGTERLGTARRTVVGLSKVLSLPADKIIDSKGCATLPSL